MADFSINPERTALLNVDMQNCFVHGSPASAPEGLQVLGRINRLAAACRAAGVIVIHVSHVLRPDRSDAGLLAEFPLIAEGMLDKGSRSAALHEDLIVEPGDLLLEKPRFGAFHGTELELLLRARSIDTVIVSGIATNVCCETTAREAAVRDFRVLFLSDGTATFDIGDVKAEEIQKMTCATIGAVFGRVVRVDDVLAALDEVQPAKAHAELAVHG